MAQNPADRDLDLFGQPLRLPGDDVGRPPFEKTKENQALVLSLVLRGTPQARIAEKLDISEPTLRKYFSDELEHAADRLEALALAALMEKAREGNVAAAGKLLEAGRRGRAAPPRPAAPERPKPLGKKEARQERASQPGGDFGFLQHLPTQ